jgi:hypothetical protein
MRLRQQLAPQSIGMVRGEIRVLWTKLLIETLYATEIAIFRKSNHGSIPSRGRTIEQPLQCLGKDLRLVHEHRVPYSVDHQQLRARNGGRHFFLRLGQ